MDRTEAIELLKNMHWSITTKMNREVPSSLALNMAIEALKDKNTNIPTKWIPVSERLPEEGYDVLITKESFKIKGYEQRVIIAKRSADPRSGKIEWWSEFGAIKDKAVLAWMPLPEPWEGE